MQRTMLKSKIHRSTVTDHAVATLLGAADDRAVGVLA